MRRLLIRPGALGDLIVSLPALESLRGSYTEVWTTSENVPLVRFADRVASIAETGLDRFGLPDVMASDALTDRLRGFHQVVSWYGTKRPEFQQAMHSVHSAAVFLDALPPETGGHAVDFYLEQARSLGGTPVLSVPSIPCRFVPRPTAVIHPFSGSATKNWPLERFRTLADRLPLSVDWCAGPEEDFASATRIEDRYELAQWLAGARLYIGNDSGVTHLAAAVGTPALAIFGPTDPGIWAPRGSHVNVLRAHSTELEDIKVSEVLEAARELLERDLEHGGSAPDGIAMDRG